MIDANFAARLGAQRKAAGITQQGLVDRDAVHVSLVHRYEASTRQYTLDVLRALNTSTDSLLFDNDGRGRAALSQRLKLEAVDRLDPDEQAHVTALIEGPFSAATSARQLTGQAS